MEPSAEKNPSEDGETPSASPAETFAALSRASPAPAATFAALSTSPAVASSDGGPVLDRARLNPPGRPVASSPCSTTAPTPSANASAASTTPSTASETAAATASRTCAENSGFFFFSRGGADGGGTFGVCVEPPRGALIGLSEPTPGGPALRRPMDATPFGSSSPGRFAYAERVPPFERRSYDSGALPRLVPGDASKVPSAASASALEAPPPRPPRRRPRRSPRGKKKNPPRRSRRRKKRRSLALPSAASASAASSAYLEMASWWDSARISPRVTLKNAAYLRVVARISSTSPAMSPTPTDAARGRAEGPRDAVVAQRLIRGHQRRERSSSADTRGDRLASAASRGSEGGASKSSSSA